MSWILEGVHLGIPLYTCHCLLCLLGLCVCVCFFFKLFLFVAILAVDVIRFWLVLKWYFMVYNGGYSNCDVKPWRWKIHMKSLGPAWKRLVLGLGRPNQEFMVRAAEACNEHLNYICIYIYISFYLTDLHEPIEPIHTYLYIIYTHSFIACTVQYDVSCPCPFGGPHCTFGRRKTFFSRNLPSFLGGSSS